MNCSAPLSIYQSPSERLASSVRRPTTSSPPLPPPATETTPVVASPVTSPAMSPATSPAAETEDPAHIEDQDIQSSIRQVTSAIVHYVSENPASRTSPLPPGAESGSPQGGSNRSLADRRSPLPRCLWVESSFVGPNSVESGSKRNPSLPPPHPPPRSLQHSSHPHASSDLHNPSRPGELMLA